MERRLIYEKPQILECYYDADDIVRTSDDKDEFETPEF